ncbi:hypothetical protein QJS10_CPB17g01406 [Acorus calamus]|uniref:Reverse transcriptase domain-containing protein n=1 Tax=Acorus calamus TaxID=4465 RepID=A0AAV9CYM4_ACOCL|nr:hypothetical protein QJS10_CPB17g01406 [Acorus calamus]
MKALSSPGPNGFPARFYQLFWDLIKEDFLLAINYFFQHGKILCQVSHSFIALIPKSLNAYSLDSYRPISLCKTFYKIITKVMALRLQPLLTKLVSNHQSAFIKDRSIHHNILLAHELIRYLNQGKPRACIKVDLKKSFDSVKINSDGSRGDDRFGYGAIVRDPNGDCLAAVAGEAPFLGQPFEISDSSSKPLHNLLPGEFHTFFGKSSLASVLSKALE